VTDRTLTGTLVEMDLHVYIMIRYNEQAGSQNLKLLSPEAMIVALMADVDGCHEWFSVGIPGIALATP
jgi:hypothetical protein